MSTELQLVWIFSYIEWKNLSLISFTETKALEEGVSPAELCAKYHALHKGIYDCKESGFIFSYRRN